MKARDIKTIDVVAWEWFDKVNGNSYFRGRIDINYNLPNSHTIEMRSQSGYDDFYRHQAFILIKKALNCFRNPQYTDWRAYEHYKIKTHHTIYRDCKHREVMLKEFNKNTFDGKEFPNP